MEKTGQTLDAGQAADALDDYAKAGFDTFDMADHYGSAELITGRLLKRYGAQRPVAFTKWCPEPGPMTPDIVRKGVTERLERLGVAKVDLLQFHWWTFAHPAWLDALHEMAKLRAEGLIGAIGVTNFDAAHLALALADGIPVISNQISFSLVDRRAAGALSELCKSKGVKLLAYGTLCGGLLSEKAGQAGAGDHPRLEPIEIQALHRRRWWVECVPIRARGRGPSGEEHKASISNVATRWVLDHPAVAACIIGARLGESEHRADNLKVFDIALDDADQALLERSFAGTKPIPGDCGDEYRKPPFLTASGDLSHHLSTVPNIFSATPMQRPTRAAVCLVGQRVGADRRLQPRRSGQGSDPGLRHDRDPRRRPLRGTRRCRRADNLHPGQDRRRDRGARRIDGGCGAHPHLSARRLEMGGGRARPWPRVRRNHAGQHADRGRQPDRRL